MPLENSKMLVKVKLHVTRMSRKKSVILVMVDGPLRNDYGRIVVKEIRGNTSNELQEKRIHLRCM